MQRIKVKRVESRAMQKGGAMVALYDEKNTRFSGFLKELKDIRDGDTVEADIQVVGRYNNIVSVTAIQHDSDSKLIPTSDVDEGSTTATSIAEAQTAFKGAVDLMATRIINSEHPLARAAVRWAVAKLGNTSYPD